MRCFRAVVCSLVVLGVAYGLPAIAAEQWYNPPSSVSPVVSATVFDASEQTGTQPMAVRVGELSVKMEVAEHQACSPHGLLMSEEDPTPLEPGQTCTLATLVMQAPEHPEFRQLIGSLATEDGGALRNLFFALYNLEAGQSGLQVVLSGFTGGAHCCMASAIVGAGPAGQWAAVKLPLQNGAGMPTIVDIHNDGGRQILFSDEQFDYTFASHAGSVLPDVIYEYAQGRLNTVTTQPRFRSYLEHQLKQMAADMPDVGAEINGALAAYVATSANMGQLQAGWRFMLKRYDHAPFMEETWCMLDNAVLGHAPYGGACPTQYTRTVPYPQKLALFLLHTGYITHAQCVALGYGPDKIKRDQAAIQAATTARWYAAHPAQKTGAGKP